MKFIPVSISLDEICHQELHAQLKRRGMTRSEYVRSLIRRDIARALRLTAGAGKAGGVKAAAAGREA